MRRPTLIAVLAASLLTSLTACANSPLGKAAEESLAADPRLRENPVTFSATNSQERTTAQLPENFPSEIPLYPNAQLQEVEPLAGTNQGQLTRWRTSDSAAQIQSFYRQQLQSNDWQLVNPSTSPSTPAETDTLEARQDDLQVKVTVNSAPTNQPTEFVVKYQRSNSETAVSPTASESPLVQKPIPTSSPQATSTPAASLEDAPEQLRQYVQDLSALGVFSAANEKNSSTAIEPNKTVNRRQYARWLIAANNRFFANNPGKQIRLASTSADPAFQDVPRTDPDFAVIQGLAEAGLIPSRLSGEATATLFRPDAPLNRQQLILWKVPLDTRQALPSATVDAVKETWGFQDAAKIDPQALRAVLADFQNSDRANIRRTFGYTTLFQPQKTVTQAEAAATLWYFGSQGDGISAADAQQIQSEQSSTGDR